MFFQKWPTSPPTPAHAAVATAKGPRKTIPERRRHDGERSAEDTAAPRQVLGAGVVPLDLQLTIVVLHHDRYCQVIDLALVLHATNGVVVLFSSRLVGIGRHGDGDGLVRHLHSSSERLRRAPSSDVVALDSTVESQLFAAITRFGRSCQTPFS